MDKSIACHNIAIESAKLFVESNFEEYKISGYSALVEELTTKYVEAYHQAEKQLTDLPVPKVRFVSKSQLGLR